jgi:hypothetical protein
MDRTRDVTARVLSRSKLPGNRDSLSEPPFTRAPGVLSSSNFNFNLKLNVPVTPSQTGSTSDCR